MPDAPHPLLLVHPVLERLAAELRARPGALAPDDGAPRRAAVAAIFRAAPETPLELLLILRAEHEGDPWSGQIALPGGRQEAQDATLQDTAIRETLEETGVDLSRDGVVLGTLDELRPRTPTLPSIIVTPFVAVVRADAEISRSEEVAEAFWAPWSLFGDVLGTQESAVTVRGAEWRVPSYVVGRHVVWGLTERILRQLAERVRHA
ncbi:MAG TPA: CoA pyrophosphatase [Gemmatimonadaceae bacterium]|nr:CoA pyrophosphatase [Gemmatimonadaceae bacterium]